MSEPTACEMMEELAAELQERGDKPQAMFLLGTVYALYGIGMDSGIDEEEDPGRRGELQAFNTGYLLAEESDYVV